MSQATPDDDPKPQPPVPPELEDCCQSGCSPCIFDLYDEELQRYKAALAEWQARRAAEAMNAAEPAAQEAQQHEPHKRHE